MLGGALSERLNWSAFVRYGQVTDRITTTNMVGKAEWLQARDAVVDPATGQIVCADAAARANGCVPLNFFSTEPIARRSSLISRRAGTSGTGTRC
jgi:iron complex outermembrane receptor protein